MDGGYTVFCIKARGKCLSPIGFVGVKRCLLLGNVSYLTHFICYFLVVSTRYPKASSLKKRGLVCLTAQGSIILGKPQQRESKLTGHIASTIGKQREHFLSTAKRTFLTQDYGMCSPPQRNPETLRDTTRFVSKDVLRPVKLAISINQHICSTCKITSPASSRLKGSDAIRQHLRS